jgi:hypothetical protein
MASVVLRRGSLYLGRDQCQRYFPDLQAVMLVRQGSDLLILPVRHAPAGGYLLKTRNAAGDRVVNAMDFFRTQGVDDGVDRGLEVAWDEQRMALVASALFSEHT